MAKEQEAHDPQAEGADRDASAERTDSLQEVVRLAQTDVDGRKEIVEGLRDIYGVGANYADAIVSVLGLDRSTQLGSLSNEKLQEIEDCITNPGDHGIPSWLVNRRRDRETGEDKHLIEADLKLAHEFDIRRLKKIRSYKGWRHNLGLPVRGQRTRSSFRGKKSVGVKRKRVQGGGEE